MRVVRAGAGVVSARVRAGAGSGRAGLGRQERRRGAAGTVPQFLLGSALDAVSEGSVITGADQRIVYVNAAFTTVTGYSREDVAGRNCRLLQGPGTDPQTVAAIGRALARRETFRGEILNYRKDGSPFWNALTVSALRDAAGELTHFVSVQRDVTAQKSLQDRLRFLALHDPLTGLPNRAALEQHLSGLAARRAPGAGHAAVGIIDLDDFKTVNDTHGHEAGDTFLTEIARRLRTQLRATDFLARLGGDEFVLVIEDLDPNDAKNQLRPILSRLHQAADTGIVLAPGISLPVKMSLGLALCRPAATAATTALRRADTALYHLKARKDLRTRWWHLDTAFPEEEPDTRPTPERTLPADTATAYRARLFNGGLTMYFQPVTDLRTGKILFLEALARLILEDGTILPAGAFLPLPTQEDTDRLFRTGLDQALAQLTVWDTAGHRPGVSVNVATSTLLHPDCPHWVASALERHSIAPHRLTLELLEDPAEDPGTQSRTFNDLVALGVRMALDDLGAGHSSLQRLTAVPFSTVKIDHRILAQLTTSPIPTMTFLTTMIHMGQNMGWDVIAEGLENPGITEAAAILGIPYGQGYDIARPLSARDIPDWMTNHVPAAPPGPIRTLPGALAYHWQLTRTGSAHPGPLHTCPLTGFLQGAGTPATQNWHRQQHTPGDDHLPAATDLLHWLTHHTTTRPAPGKQPGPALQGEAHGNHPQEAQL